MSRLLFETAHQFRRNSSALDNGYMVPGAGWCHLQQVDFGPLRMKALLRLLVPRFYTKAARGHPTKIAVLVAKTLMLFLKA